MRGLCAIATLLHACPSIAMTEHSYAPLPDNPTSDDIADYSARSKKAIQKDVIGLLKMSTPQATWCNAMDYVIWDYATDIAKAYYEALPDDKKDDDGYIAVYAVNAAKIPKFNDLIDQKVCTAVTKGENPLMVKLLEKSTKDTISEVMALTDDPTMQFNLLTSAVRVLSNKYNGLVESGEEANSTSM